MWKCNKCGKEVIAACYNDKGSILTGITEDGLVDENKIYEIDLIATEYYCEGATYGECSNEGKILSDIAYWEE